MSRSRFPRTVLVSLCDASSAPVFAVSEQGELVYANEACLQWLNVEASELLGRICRFHAAQATTEPLDRVALSLTPPPEAAQGALVRATLLAETSDQQRRKVLAWCVPLNDPAPQSAVLVLVQPQSAVEEAAADQAGSLHVRLAELTFRHRKQFSLDSIVGDSLAMRRVREQVEIAVASDACVVVTGPTGSGRERIARTIHAASVADREDTLLIPLSCDLIDGDMLQSTMETFVLQSAELQTERPGTLLLLDVDILSNEAQQVLSQWMSVPEFGIRVLSTARSSPVALAESGSFLPSLAYRLSPLQIQVPPLCERLEDVPLLAQQVIEHLNRDTGRNLAGMAEDSLEMLQAHRWPGNLAELTQRLQDAYARSVGPRIQVKDLSVPFRDAVQVDAHPESAVEPIDLEQQVREFEARYLRRAVELAGGNKAQAARLVGMKRNRFLRRWELLVGE